VNASDVTAKNSQANPNAVTLAAIAVPPLLNFQYTFPAHSLTRMAIVQAGAVGIQTLDQVQIFPNPLRPVAGHSQMNFAELPAGTHLAIFALTGEKLRDLYSDAFGVASWDGTNSAGQKAASGVYLTLIEGAGEKKTFKIAIQR
jgi:hypothetical protein